MKKALLRSLTHIAIARCDPDTVWEEEVVAHVKVLETRKRRHKICKIEVMIYKRALRYQ